MCVLLYLITSKHKIKYKIFQQKSMKAEMEVATKLLEKDVHEKQDTIRSLRDQLEDIKSLNFEMYTKLQVCKFVFIRKLLFLDSMMVE